MQGNGAHWRKVAATIWRHPQFLPNLFDICSAVRIFWIPVKWVLCFNIALAVFIPCDGSHYTVSECRRDAARWGGFTAGRSSQKAHSPFIPLLLKWRFINSQFLLWLDIFISPSQITCHDMKHNSSNAIYMWCVIALHDQCRDL